MSKYLSVIMTGRNDNYAEGFVDRFQKSIDMWSYLVAKNSFSENMEIVIVEWNPPKNKPMLKDVLSLPKNIDFRVIIIPNDLHISLTHTKYDAPDADSIPFYEFIAKNAAGRRCESPFLLFTNPDIIYNNEIVSFFAKMELNKKRFYRIDRDGITSSIPDDLDYDDQLKFCLKNIDKEYVKKNQICRTRYVHTKASGDFLLIPKWVFVAMKGYLEIRVGGAAIDRFGLYCARTVCKQNILDAPMRIYHQPHYKRADLYDKKITQEQSKMEYKSCHGTFARKDIKLWFQKCYDDMEKTGVNKNINDEKWGFIDNELEEYRINKI